jgi:phage terminase large subunit GpA-like protein
MKEFAGGVLVMTGANSAVGLRSMPIRFLMLDEIDGYPLDLDGEGSPIALAEARTRTFSRKKIYKLSTPTIEGQSAIDAEFQSTDQRYYYVPCPHCEQKQSLVFDNLKWDSGKPETVQYFCSECGSGIEERHKPFMLANGQWIAHAPQNANPKRIGYHINSLYSPYGWYSWADAVRDYEKAIADKSGLLMKTFVNTVLGLTYKEQTDAPQWQNLFDRREKYLIGIVAFLTAGVDVQKDRLEMEVVGWCKGKRSYSICYEVLLGETNEKMVWDKLKSAITRTFMRTDGTEMQISLTAVDTGYNTTHVYDFCRQFDYSKVIPIKGQEAQNVVISNPKATEVNRKGKKIGSVKIWNIGVSLCKSELYSWLRLNKYEDGLTPEGYCHFPEYAIEYFKGLTGERQELKMVRGYNRYQWVKTYERNEPLDCRVYARAAAAVIGLDRFHERDFDRMIITGGVKQTAQAAPQQKPKRELKFEFNSRK